MSALPHVASASVAPLAMPSRGRVLPAREVALRLGQSLRSVQLRAAGPWAAAGLAEKRDGEWFVSETADPRLRDRAELNRRDLEQAAACRAAGTGERELGAALERAKVVRAWQSFDARPWRDYRAAFAVFAGECAAADLPRPSSYVTLSRWAVSYARDGLLGLLRRRPPARGATAIGDAAWEHFRALVLAGNRIKLATAHAQTTAEARKHGRDAAWQTGSYSSFLVRARSELALPLRTLADKGPRAFDAECVPKGERDYEAIPAGDQYCGDEHTLDVMCRVPGSRRGGWRLTRKIKLTAWMDMRSRAIVGWLIDDQANSDTILGSLKRAIAAHGKPRVLVTDWGKDYAHATGARKAARWWDIDEFDADRVTTAIERLGIGVKPVTPYMPWAKPIERLFGTMCDHFSKQFPAYWGGAPHRRHEERDRWCRENLHLVPTIEDVRVAFALAVDAYHARPHGGDGLFGLPPAEALAKFRAEPPRLEAADVLDYVFMCFTDPKVVRRDGVRYLHSWYGWGEPQLVRLQGQKVILGLDPADAGRALVCTPDADHKPLFWVKSERWRFATKRDAERIARNRGRLRREYGRPVRAARELFLRTDPINRLADQKALHPAPRLAPPPGLTVLRPELSEDLARVAPPAADASDAPPAIELDDVIGREPQLSPAALPPDVCHGFENEDELDTFLGLNDYDN